MHRPNVFRLLAALLAVGVAFACAASQAPAVTEKRTEFNVPATDDGLALTHYGATYKRPPAGSVKEWVVPFNTTLTAVAFYGGQGTSRYSIWSRVFFTPGWPCGDSW